jgi:3-oxoisoapionate decarboxylase
MKLGINTYTYMWAIGFPGAVPSQPLTALGLLEKARQLGVALVQTGPNLPLDDPATQQAFFQQALRYGITLELGVRGLETDHLRRSIELCKQAGAVLLRTVPEIAGETPTTAEMIAYLNAIRPALEESGVTLGLENGKIPCRDLRQAVESLDSPNIGVVLDMVNSLAISEGWKEVTEVLAPYVVCLHFKDFAIQRAWHMMGFICEGRPAGQGQLDAAWLFEQLRRAPRDFNVILELWTPEHPRLEATIALEQTWAEASIPYLKQRIANSAAIPRSE